MANKSPKTDSDAGAENRKLDTFTPQWWLRVFVACFILGALYLVVTAIWPSVSFTKGMFGGSQRANTTSDPDAPAGTPMLLEQQLMTTDISKVESNPAVFKFAVASGGAAFKQNCVACHGADARGKPGFPDLTDHDWLWGGTLSAIEQTITHGVRNPDPAGRVGEMPSFLRDSILIQDQVDDVVAYVLQISSQNADAVAAKRGAQVFSQNCVNCHGPDGKGDPSVGAPNLTDSIWLYGGDPASLRQTISFARNSTMPAWSGHLPPATIRELAVYVYSLGGGVREATP